MGCSSCGTKTGTPGGCKSNGTCGTSGCNKLNVYDWLSHVERPEGFKPFSIVEIRFKGGRKEYYQNDKNLELYTGDLVVVDSDFGYEVGEVSLKGELVKLQLKKRELSEHAIDKVIQRVCNEKDSERYFVAKEREPHTLERARTIALELGLSMKLSDIEFQGDNKKVVFFYTAESRVDFRELIKRYADEFKVRIEMRQIGFRNEAARLGGIGSCGRELCCSTWLSDFKQVHINTARTQNLSINMLKLSGQCGKLKCCLNFELDTYMDALNEFPKSKNVSIQTVNGYANLQKMDILKKLMWFQVERDNNWVPLTTAQVREYLKMNEKGQKAPALMAPKPQNEAGTAVREKQDFLGSDDLLSSDVADLDRKTKNNVSSNKGGQRNNKPKYRKPGKPGERPAGGFQKKQGYPPKGNGPKPDNK
jgi:cell fate regulator YaaT (PSP1 superfamily)